MRVRLGLGRVTAQSPRPAGRATGRLHLPEKLLTAQEPKAL